MTADIQRWIDDLTADDMARRALAAEELRQAGPAAQQAAKYLVHCTGDAEESIREAAVAALEDLGPPHTEDIDALAELLSDDGSEIAYWAATLLGRLGRQGCAAARPLSTALTSHPNVNVRQQAAWALGKIGAGAACALEPLQSAAKSDDPRLARLAQAATAAIQE